MFVDSATYIDPHYYGFFKEIRFIEAIPSLELAGRHGFARIRKRATVMTVSGNGAT